MKIRITAFDEKGGAERVTIEVDQWFTCFDCVKQASEKLGRRIVRVSFN